MTFAPLRAVPWRGGSFILYLSMLTGLTALSVDMSLPALPHLATEFQSDPLHVQATLSLFLLGYGFSHLVYGALSDQFGRRPVLLGGIGLFTIASLGCALSPSLNSLILLRLIEGIGACCGPVLARAVVRDSFEGHEAARALSTITVALGLAPLLAPLMGGALVTYLNWRTIFLFLATVGALAFALTWMRFGETNHELRPGALSPVRWLEALVAIAHHRDCRRAALRVCFVYGGMLAYIGGSPGILIVQMGASEMAFGLYFGIGGIFMMIGATCNRLLIHRLGKVVMGRVGSILALIGGFSMVGAALLLPATPLTVVLPMAAFIFAVGMILPNASAEMLAPFPSMAGTVSSMMGGLQVLCGSLATAVIAHFQAGGALSLGLTLSVCALFVFAAQPKRAAKP